LSTVAGSCADSAPPGDSVLNPAQRIGQSQRGGASGIEDSGGRIRGAG